MPHKSDINLPTDISFFSWYRDAAGLGKDADAPCAVLGKIRDWLLEPSFLFFGGGRTSGLWNSAYLLCDFGSHGALFGLQDTPQPWPHRDFTSLPQLPTPWRFFPRAHSLPTKHKLPTALNRPQLRSVCLSLQDSFLVCLPLLDQDTNQPLSSLFWNPAM